MTDLTMHDRVGRLGSRLATAFEELVQAIPGSPRRPVELARTLRVDRNAAYRLLTALKQKDPLATAHLIPGPDPLRRVVKASVSKGLPAHLAAAAEEAVKDFDTLIRDEGGDRSALDAMISAWLPDVRRQIENTAKQLMYRGARQIRGVAADVTFMSIFIHPSSKHPMHHDHAYVHGHLGLRRVHHNAQFKLGVQSHVRGSDTPELTLDREPIRDDLHGVLLEQFCTGSPLELDIHRRGPSVIYGLKWGDAVGVNSARDVVLAGFREKWPKKYRQPDDARPLSGFSDAINIPTRTYICDIIFHKDAFPNWEPHVHIMETGELGVADPNDPSREFDTLEVLERIEPLGWQIDRFRLADVPDYVQILRHVCTKLGWDADTFRGYRTRIDYPIFGTQVQYTFEIPLDPATKNAE